jgi:hypothetical protein
MNYTFHDDSTNTDVDVLLYPFEDGLWTYSIPLVDVSKMSLDLMLTLLDNRHKNLAPAMGYFTKFLQLLYETVGVPDKQIDEKFIKHTNKKQYGYTKDLIDANLSLSFEELYLMLVSNTDEHLKSTDYKHLQNDPVNRFNIHYEHITTSRISKQDPQLVQEIRAITTIKKDEAISDNLQALNDKLRSIVGSTISSNNKINQIHSILQESINKNIAEKLNLKLTQNQLQFIYLNSFYNLCHFELNRGNFEEENGEDLKKIFHQKKYALSFEKERL